MNKNSLLLEYINSGGKGKERKLGENKVGRPSKADYYGEVVEGINITDEVKQHIEFAINNIIEIQIKQVWQRLIL